jgi:two-component system sensor histidine kinase HydH
MHRKGLYIPIITILATIVTLLVLLGISTVRNLHRDNVRMEESLFRDGLIVLRGLEASFRFGMQGMIGGDTNIERLISQMSDLTDIRFIALVDEKGTFIAHSDDAMVGTTYPDMEKLRNLIARDQPQSWFAADGSFVVAKRFQPLRSPRVMMGGGMMGGWRGMVPAALPDKTYAVVGLNTTLFEQARKDDIRHAVLMGLILLVLGSASFYFIVLVQNYSIVNRTLDTMTTYATNVVENMPDGLISVDAGGGIVTVNNRAREIFGLKAKTLSDERDELTKKLRAIAKPIFKSLRKGKTIIEREVEYFPDGGGPIPLSVSAARLISDGGEDLGTVFILRDLREIKELQERVARNERLAALGGLAAGVAHEIRNPLSSIKGFAQFFLKKNPPGSEDHKYSEVMIQEVERLNRVISNLLDYAKPKEPVKEKTSFADVIQRSVALIKDDALSRKVELAVDIATDIPVVQVDRDQITQVLLNIALNGLDAMQKGGRLTIRGFREQGERSVVVEIEDTGQGIPEEELPRIFNPFYTTKKTGTGLGLAIAHRIIENHGGTLSVRSTSGSGTTFRIVLPGS